LGVERENMKKILKIIITLFIIVLIISSCYYWNKKKSYNADLYFSIANNNYLLSRLSVFYPSIILAKQSSVFTMKDNYGRILIFNSYMNNLWTDDENTMFFASLTYIIQSKDNKHIKVIDSSYFEYFEHESWQGNAFSSPKDENVKDFFKKGLKTDNPKFKEFLEKNYWDVNPKNLDIEYKEIKFDKSSRSYYDDTKEYINGKHSLYELNPEIFDLIGLDFNSENNENKNYLNYPYVSKKYIEILYDDYGRIICGAHRKIDGEEKLFAWCLQSTGEEGEYTYLEDVAYTEIDLNHYQRDLVAFMEANNWNIPK